MNSLTSKSNHSNGRVVFSPKERKLQIISRDAEQTEKSEQRKPIQRKIRRSNSSVVVESAKNKDQSRSSQRNLQRRRSCDDVKIGSNIIDEKNGADRVLEFIELLAMKKDRKNPPQRSHSDPSRKKERTRVIIRKQPKKSKSASSGDLYNGGQSKTKKAHSRHGRKKEQKFSENDFYSKSSPSNSRIKKEHQRGLDPSGDDIVEKSPNGDAYQNSKPASEGDLSIYNKKGRNRHVTIKDPRFLQEHFNLESPPPKISPKKEDVDHGSIDHDSFFQEADSALGDFHLKDRDRRYRRPSKSQDALRKEYEQQQQQQQSPPQQTQSNDRQSSDGLVLHSSSTTLATNQEEDEKALQKRRRSKRRSAGGMVRNHRTHEEYTGFFLSVPNEENCKHGYGITKFSDGRIFEGSYEKGRMVEGKMTFPVVSSTATAVALVAAAFQNRNRRASLGSSGATYVGKFDEDGLKCGKGIYTTAEAIFLGEFRRDEQHGPGILIYRDGTDDADMSRSRRFIGHWKHGAKNGFGREILADGTVEREGHWEKNRFTGAVA